MRSALAVVLLFAVCLVAVFAAGRQGGRQIEPPKTRAEAVKFLEGMRADLDKMIQSHGAYAKAAEAVSTQYVRFAAKAKEVADLAQAGRADDPGQAALLQATKQMQEMQMSFNLQYLQLQQQMQNENRQFTMVSNIMKTKHDTVKNSIGNIR